MGASDFTFLRASQWAKAAYPNDFSEAGNVRYVIAVHVEKAAWPIDCMPGRKFMPARLVHP